MCASLIPVVFKRLFILRRFPENVNIPAPKIADLTLGLTTQNGDFIETSYNDFD
jgi:hypothetical protein